MNSRFSGLRGKLAAVAVAALASGFAPGAQASSIIYDITATCVAICDRFGGPGDLTGTLGLANDTFPIAGDNPLVTIDSFTFAGIIFTPDLGQTADVFFDPVGVIFSFTTNLNSAGYSFCFNVGPCEGSFGTTIPGDLTDLGALHEGPLTITAAPEPASLALLGLGLAAFVAIRRRRLQYANR